MQANRVVQSSRVRHAPRQAVAITRANRKPGARWRSAAVGMALGCAAAGAHAESFFQIEAGIGGSAYQRGGDGWWVQDGFQHKLDLTAPSFEVGLTGDLYQASHWGVSWHADWAWLGTIHTQSMATPSDANYNLKTKSCNGPCWPLANYMGTGHDQGFMLTIEPHVDYGGWRFGVEGGPYVHKATWAVDVTNWTSALGDAPINLHVAHAPKWQLGYVVGASVSRGPFRLAYQYFANGWAKTDPVPQIWKGTHVLMATYRF